MVNKSIVVLLVLVQILGVSNLYVYSNMQNQVTTLNIDKNNLQNLVGINELAVLALNMTYKNYVSTHSHTNVEYFTLLNAINITYQDYLLSHSYNNTQYVMLNATYYAYLSTHSYSNAQYNALYSTYQDYMSSHGSNNT